MKHDNGYIGGNSTRNRRNDEGSTKPGPKNKIHPESDRWNQHLVQVWEMKCEKKNHKTHRQWMSNSGIEPIFTLTLSSLTHTYFHSYLLLLLQKQSS